MAKKKTKKRADKKVTKKKAAKKKSGNTQTKSKSSGYAFILTPIEPQVDVPYQVIPNHFLQKADSVQISKIKQALERFNTKPFFQSPYENNVLAKPGDKPGNVRFEYKNLPPEKWRYWIISFQGTNKELQELGYALNLMEQDVELGFHYMSLAGNSWDAFAWHSQNLHTYFNDSDRQEKKPKRITSPDLQLAGECYSKIKELPEQHPHIKRAFRRLDTLRSLPLASELTVIGLFTVIESLLTHAPNNNDPTDSLVRQIKHKIPLVRKRFRRMIDHNIFFDPVNEDKLWERLYAFRSKIVHGERADISGKLSVLKNQKVIVKFLREIVKLLLIQSLLEPILLTDLKEC